MTTPILLFAVLLLAPASNAVFKNDFSAYPEASQECLYASADSSGCDGDTVKAMNDCLCGNGGDFATKTASCLAASDPSDLETVYDTMDSACSNSGTPLAVSRAEFLSAKPDGSPSGTASPSSTESGSPTATHKPDPTDASDGDGNGGEGLSSKAKTGIVAGSVVAGVALLSALVFFFIRRRGRIRTPRDESHPMLPGQGRFASSEASGDPSEYQKQGDKWQTNQGSNWESPYESPWGHSPLDPATGYPVGAQTHQPLYELPTEGTMTAPVEMAGDPIQPHPAGSGQQYTGAGWGPTSAQPQQHFQPQRQSGGI